MLDSKFFFTLVGLVVAVFAICNTNMSPSVSEGFFHPRNVKVMREVHPHDPNQRGYAMQNNYQAMLGNDKFYSQPNFQGILSPRYGNVDYGANIRYNLPSNNNLGVPHHPLGMAEMAKEDYEHTPENFVPSCGKGGVSLDGQVSMNDPISTHHDYTTHAISDGLLPVGDMTTINDEGQVKTHAVYDRLIFANSRSKLRGHADLIRGDLAIVPQPICSIVSANPNIDLHQGAMNVLGGPDNETARALRELQYATSGGYNTTFGGVDMANEFATTLGAGMADVNVTAFV